MVFHYTYLTKGIFSIKSSIRNHKSEIGQVLYFLMMASSLFVVAAGQRSGAVKIALFRADPHLQVRSVFRNRFIDSRIMIWALRTFLFRYSMTVSTLTAS